MSRMYDPFVDPGAGRYSGDDRAVARAFAELQQQMREMRGDAIVLVTAALALGGQYAGQELIDRTLADGLIAPDANWGMSLAAPTIVIVNTLEAGATTHNIPIGTRLIGRRRPGAAEADTIFVNYPAAALYGLQWAAFYDTGASLLYGIGNPG